VARGNDDPFFVAVTPIGNAAMNEAQVCRSSGAPTLGIIGPQGFAGSRIDRGDLTEGGARVQHALDHEGRGFELSGCPPKFVERYDLGIDGLPSPCYFQVAEVIARDLVEGRILRAALVAPI